VRNGRAENTELENAGPKKAQNEGLKTAAWKMQAQKGSIEKCRIRKCASQD